MHKSISKNLMKMLFSFSTLCLISPTWCNACESIQSPEYNSQQMLHQMPNEALQKIESNELEMVSLQQKISACLYNTPVSPEEVKQYITQFTLVTVNYILQIDLSMQNA